MTTCAHPCNAVESFVSDARRFCAKSCPFDSCLEDCPLRGMKMFSPQVTMWEGHCERFKTVAIAEIKRMGMPERFLWSDYRRRLSEALKHEGIAPHKNWWGMVPGILRKEFGYARQSSHPVLSPFTGSDEFYYARGAAQENWSRA